MMWAFLLQSNTHAQFGDLFLQSLVIRFSSRAQYEPDSMILLNDGCEVKGAVAIAWRVI